MYDGCPTHLPVHAKILVHPCQRNSRLIVAEGIGEKFAAGNVRFTISTMVDAIDAIDVNSGVEVAGEPDGLTSDVLKK